MLEPFVQQSLYLLTVFSSHLALLGCSAAKDGTRVNNSENTIRVI